MHRYVSHKVKAKNRGNPTILLGQTSLISPLAWASVKLQTPHFGSLSGTIAWLEVQMSFRASERERFYQLLWTCLQTSGAPPWVCFTPWAEGHPGFPGSPRGAARVRDKRGEHDTMPTVAMEANRFGGQFFFFFFFYFPSLSFCLLLFCCAFLCFFLWESRGQEKGEECSWGRMLIGIWWLELKPHRPHPQGDKERERNSERENDEEKEMLSWLKPDEGTELHLSTVPWEVSSLMTDK